MKITLDGRSLNLDSLNDQLKREKKKMGTAEQ
jgi:hypothetical protein